MSLRLEASMGERFDMVIRGATGGFAFEVPLIYIAKVFYLRIYEFLKISG